MCHGQVHKVAIELKRAKRPVVVVGSGARADYLLVRRFAMAQDLPVVHTMGGTGVIASDNRLYGGFLRHNGSKSARRLMDRADLVLALGTGLDERAVGNPFTFARHAIKIHVDVDDEAFHRWVPVDITICSPVDVFIRAIEPLLPQECRRRNWTREVKHHQERRTAKRGGMLSARELSLAISAGNRNAVLVKDSGSHKYWLTRYAHCAAPGQSIASCHFGAMGFALPAAIGVSTARPDKEVIAGCGDGCLLMSIAELVTVANGDYPKLKIVVFNNAGLGSTRDYEKYTWPHSRRISDYGRPMPIAQYAAALGIESKVVDSRQALAGMIDRLAQPGPILFDCYIDPDESAGKLATSAVARPACVTHVESQCG
jgi:acetolactate synthase-1/2/3 large subunit